MIESAKELCDLIPAHWRNAEIYIANGIGNAIPIKRVSLHTDSSGRKVILLHDEELKRPE